MNRDSKSFAGLVVAGLFLMLLASCSSENKGTTECTNCGFWDLAYGGVGRYPAASPDPLVIAFASNYLFPEKLMAPADRDNLGLANSYNIWIARTEAASDTVWYYQVTSSGDDDFLPTWSPDGKTIAFERNIGTQDQRQIFAVDVTDFANPGVPVQVTERTTEMYNSTSASWAVVDGGTWISFATGPKGGGDLDIALVRYPGLDSLATVSIDPSDFAVDENGVMSYVFDDMKPAANGTAYLTFASPNRLPVGDFIVLANSEEVADSLEVSPIFVNGKDSGKYTPYTFRYRPAGILIGLSGELPNYCQAAGGNFSITADTLTSFVMDFVHTRGTLGVRSNPGRMQVYVNGELMYGEGGIAITTPVTGDYAYVKCIAPDDTFSVSLRDVFGTPCGDPIDARVAAGETTFVSFNCEGGAGPSVTVSAPPNGALRSAAPVLQEFNADMLSQGEDERSIWLMDLGDDISTEDDRLYHVEPFAAGSNFPVLSPDGKYIAYFRGNYTAWEIVIADVTPLLEGSGEAELIRVGLPGSNEDIECWRKPEGLSWLPLEAGRKLVAALSPCRGGDPSEYSIYVADLDSRLSD